MVEIEPMSDSWNDIVESLRVFKRSLPGTAVTIEESGMGSAIRPVVERVN